MSLVIFARSFCGYVVYHFDSLTLPCRLSSSTNLTACKVKVHTVIQADAHQESATLQVRPSYLICTMSETQPL